MDLGSPLINKLELIETINLFPVKKDISKSINMKFTYDDQTEPEKTDLSSFELLKCIGKGA